MSAAGRYSVVDELVNANPVILMGEGELIKQPDQEGVPDEPGRVQFELRYAPMAKDIPHGQTIELGFRALDEAGARILRWQPASEGKVPLPRYDLAGMVELVTSRSERGFLGFTLILSSSTTGSGHYPSP